MSGWAVILGGALLVSGCATGRNYDSEMDALNAKIAALQSRLSGKDAEISKLDAQVNEEKSARDAALKQVENSQNELRQALARAKAAAEAKKTEAPKYPSDLK